jgi:hypothetical protein
LWNCFVIEYGDRELKYLIADTLDSMRMWLEKIHSLVYAKNRIHASADSITS